MRLLSPRRAAGFLHQLRSCRDHDRACGLTAAQIKGTHWSSLSVNRIDFLRRMACRQPAGCTVSFWPTRPVLITGASGISEPISSWPGALPARDLGLKFRSLAVVQRGVPDFLQPLAERGLVQFLVGNMADADFLREAAAGRFRSSTAATYGQPGCSWQDARGTLCLNTTCTMGLLEQAQTGWQVSLHQQQRSLQRTDSSAFSRGADWHHQHHPSPLLLH